MARASMRPAHQAREVTSVHTPENGSTGGFNEARASSAGSNAPEPARFNPLTRFNEARASSAGSIGIRMRQNCIRAASMRPAHQAREVRNSH